MKPNTKRDFLKQVVGCIVRPCADRKTLPVHWFGGWTADFIRKSFLSLFADVYMLLDQVICPPLLSTMSCILHALITKNTSDSRDTTMRRASSRTNEKSALEHFQSHFPPSQHEVNEISHLLYLGCLGCNLSSLVQIHLLPAHVSNCIINSVPMLIMNSRCHQCVCCLRSAHCGTAL